MSYVLKTEGQLRKAFWQGNAHLKAALKRGQKDGIISPALADRVTL